MLVIQLLSSSITEAEIITEPVKFNVHSMSYMICVSYFSTLRKQDWQIAIGIASKQTMRNRNGEEGGGL